MSRFIGFPLFFAVFILSQCSYYDRSPLGYSLPPEGSWYGPGDFISLVQEGQHQKTVGSLICTITQNEKILFQEEYPSGGTISFSIPPQSETGSFTVSYFSTKENNQTGSVNLYYYNQIPQSLDLSVYPPLAMVNTVVEGRCHLSPLEGNPHFVWKLNGKTLSSQSLEDGGDRVCFFGPPKKGRYSLTVDVYPSTPLTHDPSPWSESMEIFIDDTVDQDGTLSSEDWLALFYCDGSFIDRGHRVDLRPLDLSHKANLVPRIIEGDRGLGFLSDSSLVYRGAVIPTLLPSLYHLRTRFVLEELGEDESTLQIFHSHDGKRDYSFSLLLQGNNLLYSHGVGGEYIRSSLEFPQEYVGEPLWLSLVLVMEGKKLLIQWYLNDILVNVEAFPSFGVKAFDDSGRIITWGEGNYPSFKGVLLEWGFSNKMFPMELGEELDL